MITRPTSIKGHGPSWTELELSQHDTFLLSSISTHASSRKSHAPGGRRPDPGADERVRGAFVSTATQRACLHGGRLEPYQLLR